MVLLSVPRFAGRREPGQPAVEITLESANPAGQRGTVAAPAVAQAAKAEPPAVLPADPLRPEAPAPAAPAVSETSRTEALPRSIGEAEGSSAPDGPARVPSAETAGSKGPGGTGSSGSAGSSSGGASRAAGGTDSGSLGGASGSATLIPQPRTEILPVYPRSARKAGWQGVVTVRAFIDETGKVVSAVVLVSSGHESLDLAAVAAVQGTRFDPAVREERPVSSPLLIPVRFRLN